MLLELRAHVSINKKLNQIFIILAVLRRVTSCGAHLRGLAPGQHSSEEMSQRWRAVGDTVSDLTGRESNPRPPAPIACA